MGFDFDVGALTGGALFHGSTFNGGWGTLEFTHRERQPRPAVRRPSGP